ncbi:hypothetical protein BED47_20960 [Gottfriedia luciferensis]|uniref:Transcriptional regulator n=1 Tax=Gottfriedia luciferensis TaxID=178774 RepID=A0ABX2ZS85_9BACI|nr:hypothetical protein [Gottfriedia luciferensis]ODG92257.1 hypothetical protein BED47_20960 [Gottfriedia luciferensis]
MYRIGLVGPEWSIERILSFSKEYEHEMKFFPFAYEEPVETKDILKKHDQDVDVWLFSGQLPYNIAKKILHSSEKLLYIPHTEATVYKSLLNIMYHTSKLIRQLSVDMPMYSNLLEDALEQLSNPFDQLYIKRFEGEEINLEEILQFHLELWEANETEGVLTNFPTIFQELKKREVPVEWISTSRVDIRQTLKLLTEKVKGLYFKDSQIGVELIEIENFEEIIKKAKSPYHLQHIELRIKNVLLTLCEQLNGSLIEKGYGKYLIYSSRGAIEREIKLLENTVEQLSLESDSKVSVGIGFGETVFSAEKHAIESIQQSKETNNRKIIIVQENGEIIESVGREEEFTYAYRTDDQELLQKLKLGNISVKTFHKIQNLVKRMGWSDFTTKNLAEQLNMTERNARRIVADLCEVELLECIGEESLSFRGRPSKIYRFK